MSRPNLIYIIADQLGYHHVGYSGNPRARTPNIDRFARQSVNFSNAVSNTPVCAAHRASLFTGKHTTSTGMVINELRMNPGHRCLGHVVTEAGYQTAYIGKWHLWANKLGHHYDPANSFTPRGPYRLGWNGFWASYGFHHRYWDTYYHTESREKITIPGYEPDGQTGLAIDWLRGARVPFFGPLDRLRLGRVRERRLPVDGGCHAHPTRPPGPCNTAGSGRHGFKPCCAR